MRTAVTTSTQVRFAALLAAAGLGLSWGCDDQGSQRRGGGAIPDLSAGSGAVAPLGGSPDAGAGGAADGEQIVQVVRGLRDHQMGMSAVSSKPARA